MLKDNAAVVTVWPSLLAAQRRKEHDSAAQNLPDIYYRTILRQLIESHTDNPRSASPTFQRFISNSGDFEQPPPSNKELKALIQGELRNWERVFILVDELEQDENWSVKDFIAELAFLQPCSILFTGSPTYSLSYFGGQGCNHQSCTSVNEWQEGALWAECQVCDTYFCSLHHETGPCCSR
jgi:hypothetical protein